MSTGGKLGGAAVVGVLLLLLGLSFGGPGSKGDGPDPSPEPEPNPPIPVPDPGTWTVWTWRDLLGPSPANVGPAQWAAGFVPSGSEFDKARVSTTSRELAVAGALNPAAKRIMLIVPVGTSLTGDIEDFLRDVRKGKTATGQQQGPNGWSWAVYSKTWNERSQSYEWSNVTDSAVPANT